jgi:hypothetical protein
MPEVDAVPGSDPILVTVIDGSGNVRGNFGVAPEVGITSLGGAEHAILSTAHDEIDLGSGPVGVAGDLTREVYEVSRAKAAVVRQPQVTEISDTDFQADLEASGLWAELSGTEAVAAEPAASPDPDIKEVHDGDPEGERSRLPSHLGEIMLFDFVAGAGDEVDDAPAEDDESPRQPRLLGGLILSEMTILTDTPEWEDDLLVEYPGEPDEATTEPIVLREPTEEELQALSSRTTAGMLGALMVMGAESSRIRTV